MSLRLAFVAAALLSSAFLVGCSPRIGDGCSTATNCSINGDRLCDTSQPGGACTVYDCQPDRCPDNSVCVRFNPDPARRAVVACMKRCGGDGDCRIDQGYVCRGATDFTMDEDGLIVEIVDRSQPDGRFCIADTPGQ
jgi:hypothetical protein